VDAREEGGKKHTDHGHRLRSREEGEKTKHSQYASPRHKKK
jgi:hypothetical protein